MDVSLNDGEIKEALAMYVSQQGIDTAGKHVAIALRSGRGGNGHTASVVISSPGTSDVDASKDQDGDDTESLFGSD